jgi:hypothetical protein
VEGVVGHLLTAELRALLGEVLESGIFGQALLGAEAVELWVSACEAVTLEGGVGGGLLLELCEGVGAGRAFWAAEEGHFGCACLLEAVYGIVVLSRLCESLDGGVAWITVGVSSCGRWKT